jgi:photosystem II stability/assembly factor-like uncharacterized protein
VGYSAQPTREEVGHWSAGYRLKRTVVSDKRWNDLRWDRRGRSLRSSDGALLSPANRGLTSRSVAALGASGGVLYAGIAGGGTCISRDGGDSWQAINNQKRATLNIYAFAFSGRRVFAGSVYGVFVTEDEGQSWQQINAGLVDIYVTALAVSGDRLIASTARGGIFSSQIPQ